MTTSRQTIYEISPLVVFDMDSVMHYLEDNDCEILEIHTKYIIVDEIDDIVVDLLSVYINDLITNIKHNKEINTDMIFDNIDIFFEVEVENDGSIYIAKA